MNTPNTPAPSTPAAPSMSPPMVEPHPKAALSPTESAQLAQWAKEDFAKGKITQAQLEQQFTELNTPQEQRNTTDTRTPEQKQLDTLHPPAKPNDYIIRYSIPGQETPMTPELKQFDTAARTWMTDAGLTREIGNSLANAIGKVVETTHKMTDAQLESYALTEYARLERAYGSNLETKLQSAAQMIHALESKQPGLKTFLKSKGIGDSAIIASMLIQQAERWHERRGRS